MKIYKLNIFSIHKFETLEHENFSVGGTIAGSTNINYVEINIKDFLSGLEKSDLNFLEYNKYSLFIFRDCNFYHVKSFINKINGFDVNISKGGGQKAHLLSPLEIRLSCYLMAMFNFNYQDISSLNIFNILSKDKYMCYKENKSNN